MTIKKPDIAQHIKETFKFTLSDSKLIVNEVFHFMREGLKRGEEIYISEFLHMGVKDALSRNTNHPRNQQQPVTQYVYKKVYCHFTAHFRSIIKNIAKNSGE